MKRLHRLGIVLCACLGLAAPWAAASHIDLTDVWFDANEPGWAVSISQQGETLFLTVHTYDASNRPVWYVASSVPGDAGVNFDPCGSVGFGGKLYETHGAPHGSAPVPMQAREVGQVAIQGYTVPTCDQRKQIGIQITIDGRTVSRTLQRYTWAEQAITGRFAGALVITGNCDLLPPVLSGSIEIARTGSEFRVTVNNDQIFPGNMACTLTGPYRQAGRAGRIAGTQQCIVSDMIFNRTFVLDDLRVDRNGLTAEIAYPGCGTAKLGGARRAP